MRPAGGRSPPTPKAWASSHSGAHPALVATFLGHLRDGGASAQTLGSRAAAIRFFHRAAGIASPTDQRTRHKAH